MPNKLAGEKLVLSAGKGCNGASGLMMALSVFLASFCLLYSPIAESACTTCQPRLEWKISQNSPANSDEVAYGVAYDSSGNFAVGGTVIRDDLVQGADWQVIKYLPSGTPDWTAVYNSADSGDDVVRSVATDPSGNILAAGFEARTGEGRNLMVRKYAPDGAVLWTRTWNDADNGDDMAYGVAVDGSSNVVVAGSTFSTAENEDWLVVKYNPSGDVLWTFTFAGAKSEADEAMSVAVDAGSGSIFVAGYEKTAASEMVWRFIKLDPAGATIWGEVAPGANNTLSSARGAALDNHGDMLVGGNEAASATNSKFRVQKWLEGGAGPAWDDSHDPFTLNDSVNSLAVTWYGGVLAAGRQTPVAGDSKWLVRMFGHSEGPTASVCWTFSCYGSVSPNNAAFGSAVDPYGRFLVVGGEEVAGEGANWTVRMFTQNCLSASLSQIPVSGGTGRDFLVNLTVTNNGTGPVNGITMTTTHFVVAGTGVVSAGTGPNPAMPSDLASGASITWSWTFTGTVPGTASFSCTLTGINGSTGSTEVIGPVVSPAYTVLVPAALEAMMSYNKASVCNGNEFIVTLTVTNTGEVAADSVTPSDILEDPTGKVLNKNGPFPSLPVSLAGGESVTFTWTFQGTSAGTVAFMTTATGTDSESAAALSAVTAFTPGFVVTEPGELDASAFVAPNVSVGQSFIIVLSVTNTGASALAGVTPKIAVSPAAGPVAYTAGPYPASTTLDAGGSILFTWTFTGASAGAVTFTMTVMGSTCGGGTIREKTAPAWTTVQAAANLKSAVAMIPAKANVGQDFLVTVTVTNTGGAAATGVVVADPVAWGGGTASLAGPNPPVPHAQLNGGASITFTWTMTGETSGAIRWSSTASGTDINSGAGVSAGSTWSAVGGAIQTPASLSARAVAYVSPLCVNSQTIVTVTVTNTGEAPADAVTAPDFQQGGTGGLAKVTGSALPMSLNGGSSTTFTWVYRGTVTGPADLTTTVSGTDRNTGVGVANAMAVTSVVDVANQGALNAAGSAPLKASTMQVFQVSMTVTNTGGAVVNAVVPRIAIGPGLTQVVYQTGPVPASAVLAPASATTFVWTYLAATEAVDPVAFTMTAEGSTCGGGVSTEDSITVWTRIERKASLPSFVRMTPGTVSSGQSFMVSVTVSNTGEARANNVTVDLPTAWGGGNATAPSGPYPAVPYAQINGGGVVTFTWTMTASTSGPVRWSTTVSGTDANSGGAVQNASSWSASGNSVQVPASLSGSSVVFVSPVCSGSPTLVTMTVTNSGEAGATGVTAPAFYSSGSGSLSALSGPTPAFPQPIPGGGHLTFTWTFQGGTTGAADLSTTVTGNDGNGGWALTGAKTATSVVSIVAPGALSSAGSVPTRVSTSQIFQVSLTVTNTGGAAFSSVVPAMVAVSGASAVTYQSGPVPAVATIAPGASRTFVWTYAGTASGVPSFTMSAQGITCNNGTILEVQSAVSTTVETKASLVSQVGMDPAWVTVGQQFMITETVTNTGQAIASGVSAVIPSTLGVGNATLADGPSPAMPVSIPGGDSVTFTWTMTASVAGPARWSVTTTGNDANSGLAITTGPVSSPAGSSILTPAALSASMARTPATLCSGRDFLVTLTITNTGQTQANGVTAEPLLVAGTGTADPVSGPFPAMPVDIAGGASKTFSYTYTGMNLGTVAFMTTVTGTDANLASPVNRITGFTPDADVTSPGVLSVAGSVPARMSTNQLFTVTLTVTNTGGAQVTGVTPALALGPGSGLVSYQSGPSPASSNINSGSAVTFSWTYRALSGGLVAFTATASGNTCAGASALQASSTVSSTISLEAALVASIWMMRTNANIGQSFMVTVTVTNTGQASANGMDIELPSICTSGGASLASGPNPALPVVLAGGTSRTFTWTFTGTTAGPAEFTATATGTDAYAGTPVTSGPVTDARFHRIEAPAALDASLTVSSTSAVTAQKFMVMLTVTNTGGATAWLDRPVLKKDGSAGSTQSVLPGTFPRAMPGGTTIVFTWTATPGMEGSLQFSTTAQGADANTGTALLSASAHPTPFEVIGIPVLQVVSFAPSRESVAPGESVTLKMAIKSAGTTSATNLVPSAPVLSGDGTLVPVSGPVPASIALLAPGDTGTFTWVYRSASIGTVRISLGADADNTAAVSAGTVVVYVARTGGVPKDVVVDPNPLHTRSGGTVRFINVPSFASVRLFTISGEPVKAVTADIFGVAVWNGKNNDGTVVAPGVYLFAVESPGTKRYVGKILVVQ